MSDTDKLLNALCYIFWPVALILLLLQQKKHMYHAINGLAFAGTAFILCWVLMFVPFIGWILSPIYWIAVVVVAIIFAVDAYKGRKPVIPLVTEFLQKNVKQFN
ncbi:MAG: hypothetical protein OXR66_06885 [Candidatus Woesearchaeota archaeon]|nr:hypothetical protein [Candidatus Woesearchaeota archaeon]